MSFAVDVMTPKPRKAKKVSATLDTTAWSWAFVARALVVSSSRERAHAGREWRDTATGRSALDRPDGASVPVAGSGDVQTSPAWPTRVDGSSARARPAPGAGAPEARPSNQGSRLLGGVQTVEEQLRRLEARLLAEADRDRAAEEDVRRHLALARACFGSARIRQFLPILIERDVRRRLSGR
jgi:hypothetical protein